MRLGVNGPTALESRFGWVLSRPVHCSPVQVTCTNLISSHVLKQEASCIQHHDLEQLDLELKRFWDLETLGIGEKLNLMCMTNSWKVCLLKLADMK